MEQGHKIGQVLDINKQDPSQDPMMLLNKLCI